MTTRGGDHRKKVEDVDFTVLFEEHVKEMGVAKALQFGVYENMDRTQAAYAAGLASNKVLLAKASLSFFQRMYLISMCSALFL